jgi:SET domain-containing protein
MNWWKKIFPDVLLTFPYKPSIESLKIRVDRHGSEEFFTPKEVELLTGAKFAPWLEMGSDKIHRSICRLGAKLRRQGHLSIEQLWQGNYYQKEMESNYQPDVVLRWINDQMGWGVFAARSFKTKEYIAEYTGILRRWQRSDRRNGYCFEYVHESGKGTSFLIDARDQAGIARYINHSSKPNLQPTLATVGSITHLILLVKKPIQKGEQLCYDYGPAYWSKRSAPIIF